MKKYIKSAKAQNQHADNQVLTQIDDILDKLSDDEYDMFVYILDRLQHANDIYTEQDYYERFLWHLVQDGVITRDEADILYYNII